MDNQRDVALQQLIKEIKEVLESVPSVFDKWLQDDQRINRSQLHSKFIERRIIRQWPTS